MLGKFTGLLLLPFVSVILAAPISAQIEWADHPVTVDDAYRERVDFGWFTVPESREDSSSRQIEIAFTRIRNTAGRQCSDPVIVLPGGPGQGSSAAVNVFCKIGWVQRILEERDIVLLDPRGCGLSRPKLCPNLNDRSYVYNSFFLEGQAWRNNLVSAMEICADSLAAKRVALESYNSVAIARDIEDLRLALGYERWNIRGQSYGTYYGFILMQEFPASVRSAFLSGIISLEWQSASRQHNFRRALTKVVAACKEDSACSRNVPQLEVELLAILDRLDTNPIVVDLPAGGEGDYRTYYITPKVFLLGLHQLLYRRSGIEFVPALIHSLYGENDWVLQHTAEMLLQYNGIDQDMLTVIQSNDADLNRAEAPSPAQELHAISIRQEWLPGDASRHQLAWNLLRPNHALPVKSFGEIAIPTVLMSGELDPITPPEQGEFMMRYFTEAVHHIVPNTGHYSYTDVDFSFDRYVRDPRRELERTRVYQAEPLNFVTGISHNRGISRMMADLQTGDYLAVLPPVIAIVLALISLLILVVGYLRARRNREWIFPGGIGALVGGLAAATLSSGGLLVWALVDALDQNPFILALGVPARWGWLTAIFIAYPILFFGILLWIKPIWRSSLRLPGTIAVMGGAAFVFFIVVGGLL